LLAAFGQNDPFFSYYMFNRTFFNPAAAGSEKLSTVTLQHRSQWLGYSSSFDGSGGAPSTQLLTVDIPVERYISGIGATIVNDNLGPQSNFAVQIPISYTIPLRFSSLSIGLMPGFFSRTLKFDELRFNDPSDPFNVGTRETQGLFNLGAGLFYQTDKSLFIGVGATNLLEPEFNFGIDSLLNRLEMGLNATAGFTFPLTRNLDATPSLLVRSDLNTYTFDINMMMDYKNLAWGGLSFRRSEALVVLLGYSFLANNELKVGYALDIIVNEQDAKQPTSHEFVVRYNVPNFRFGGKKPVKSPRFSF
ncbi:MAG: PorP/SprF family type IX secretion system membrane protein, partial [Bacteroidota bacterium]